MSVVLAQDPDRVPGRMIAVAGLIAFVVIALSMAIVFLLGGGGRGARPAPAASIERGELSSGLLGAEATGEREAREAARHLSRWGYTDRARGRVHVPIDVALDHYLAREATR